MATPAPTAGPHRSPTAAAAFPVTLTDDEGTAVAIPAEPSGSCRSRRPSPRPCSRSASATGSSARARTSCSTRPRRASIPDVEKFDGSAVVVDVEKIVADKADLVIAGGNFGTPPDAVQKLRGLGIPVVVVYAPDVDDRLGDIALQGEAVGKPAEAAAIVDQMQAAFKGVTDAVTGAPRPRVFYEIDATGAFYGPADKSFLAEMITLAGGDPITTGSPDKYDIPAERLLTADPAGHPARRRRLRRQGRGRREAARLVDDDRRQGRRDPPDRRHDDHAAGPAAVHRPRAARRGDPSRPGDPVRAPIPPVP